MPNFKLISAETDLDSMDLVPLDWDAYVGDIPFHVYRIPGFVHSIVHKFGENDYWACRRNEKPTYHTLIKWNGYAPYWGIRVEETNYYESGLGVGYGQGAIMYTTSCWITRNGKEFYRVKAGSLESALVKAQFTLTELQEHPLNFHEIDFDKKLVGRKIYYNEQPAVLLGMSYEGNVHIRSESPGGFRREAWQDSIGVEDIEYYEGRKLEITRDLLSDKIWWFRS